MFNDDIVVVVVVVVVDDDNELSSLYFVIFIIGFLGDGCREGVNVGPFVGAAAAGRGVPSLAQGCYERFDDFGLGLRLGLIFGA